MIRSSSSVVVVAPRFISCPAAPAPTHYCPPHKLGIGIMNDDVRGKAVAAGNRRCECALCSSAAPDVCVAQKPNIRRTLKVYIYIPFQASHRCRATSYFYFALLCFSITVPTRVLWVTIRIRSAAIHQARHDVNAMQGRSRASRRSTLLVRLRGGPNRRSRVLRHGTLNDCPRWPNH